MANLHFEDGREQNGTSNTKVDNTVWNDLPQHLQEKCLGHLPVLTIASTLREVNRMWSSYPGTSTFKALHGHRKNINSSFGFLMFGTKLSDCVTMALDHNTLKWQLAPSLQLNSCTCYVESWFICYVESVSEGLLCLQPSTGLDSPPPPSPPFIVWNPLLPSSCKQTIPRMCEDNYWNVNLVVDKESATFKILAFTSLFQECHIFSSITGSWLSHKEGPRIYEGLYFPRYRDGRRITVTYKNCLYVAVGDLIDGVRQVGDLCYDVNMNVWKSLSGMFPLPSETLKVYGHCFTRSLFVISDVMYKVVEYVAGSDLVGAARPSPMVQILARSLALENNAEKWRVIATTVYPQAYLVWKRFGTWYGCILDGHEKPTICGLIRFGRHLTLMTYNIGNSKWKITPVIDEATNRGDLFVGIRSCIGRNKWWGSWILNCDKKLAMNMVPNYEPSWICPSVECNHRSREGIEEL